MEKIIIIPKNDKEENENNIINILKKIFNIKEDKTVLSKRSKNNRFTLYQNNKKLCQYQLEDYAYNYDNILNIFVGMDKYSYAITNERDNIFIKLILLEKVQIENTVNKHFISQGYNKIMNIQDDNLGLEIEISEEKIADENFLFKQMSSLNCNFSLEEIYNQVKQMIPLEKLDSLKIEKYIVLDTAHYEKITTDILSLRKGILEEYLNTIKRNDKIYTIKKENNNYVIKCMNTTAEDILGSYFYLNDSIKFIKKLEKK